MPEEQPSSPSPSGGSDVEQNKTLAIIGYLGILFLVPLLAAPKSQFAQYHARQGLALFILEIVVIVLWWILVFIPFVGALIDFLLWVGIIVLTIMGILNASKGEMKPLPLIGGLAEKK